MSVSSCPLNGKDANSAIPIKRSRLSLNKDRNRILNFDIFQIKNELKASGISDNNTDFKAEVSTVKESFSDQTNEACLIINSLKNLGNTCYLNSVLYCLVFIKEFRKAVHDAYVHLQLKYSEDKRSMFTNFSDDVVLQLHELFKQMIQVKEIKNSSLDNVKSVDFKRTILSPTKLLESLRKINTMFEGGSQNDAHDALKFIMSCLEAGRGNVPDQKSNTRKKTTNANKEDAETFSGKLLMKTKCLECENWTQSVEAFSDIAIPISTSITNFEKFLKMEETLRGDVKYNCEICDHSNEAIRTCEYLQFPPVLTINLKPCYTEYEHLDGFHKLSTESFVPEELPCLNETCQPKPCTNKSHKFVLLAVVCHLGASVVTGHYITYVRSSVMYERVSNLQESKSEADSKRMTRNKFKRNQMMEKMNANCCDPTENPQFDKWILFDDEHVKPISCLPCFDDMSTETPYLLFYRPFG